MGQSEGQGVEQGLLGGGDQGGQGGQLVTEIGLVEVDLGSRMQGDRQLSQGGFVGGGQVDQPATDVVPVTGEAGVGEAELGDGVRALGALEARREVGAGDDIEALDQGTANGSVAERAGISSRRSAVKIALVVRSL